MNNFTKALALLTVGLGFAACTPMTTNSSSATGTALVRVAHLSPNTPAVDIWLDGKVVDGLKNVPFKAVSGYLSIPAGKHDIAVYVAGTSSNPAIDVKGLALDAKRKFG